MGNKCISTKAIEQDNSSKYVSETVFFSPTIYTKTLRESTSNNNNKCEYKNSPRSSFEEYANKKDIKVMNSLSPIHPNKRLLFKNIDTSNVQFDIEGTIKYNFINEKIDHLHNIKNKSSKPSSRCSFNHKIHQENYYE